MLPPSTRQRPPTSCQGSMHWAPISKRSCGKSNPDLQPFNPCIIPVLPEFIPQKGNLSETHDVYSQAHSASPLWKGSDGRVARLSSAKAATAVRIRFGPPTPESPKHLLGVFCARRIRPSLLESESKGAKTASAPRGALFMTKFSLVSFAIHFIWHPKSQPRNIHPAGHLLSIKYVLHNG